MMRSLAILAMLILLQGCAMMSTPKGYAVCKAADIGTTYYALHHGFEEANPLMKQFTEPSILPIVLMSIGLYALLDYVDNKNLNVTASAVTCTAAAYNAVLIIR